MEEQQRTVQYVKVKNSNTFPIKDRFDGVPYTIGAGKTETLPAEAVEHVFGFVEGCDMELVYHYTVQRHGWNTSKTTEEDARKFVGNISFTPVVARLVMEGTDQPTVSTSQPHQPLEIIEIDEIPTRSRKAGGLKGMFASAGAALASKPEEGD